MSYLWAEIEVTMKKLDINHPIRIERRMMLAHFLGLEELERELWKQLQEVQKDKKLGD